jgi:hypothetical protein
MNDTYIVTVYAVLDDLLKVLRYHDDGRAELSAAEILTVAVVAAKYFQNHHERALYLLVQLGYLHAFSVSRFNRRLHALREWLWHIAGIIGEVLAKGKVFIVDTLPIPICKRVRAKRCRKVQGSAFAGYCAAKQEHYFGWQLHLVCDVAGVPVAFELLPAACDELVPIQELLATLPEGSQVVADKGYVSQKDELLAYCYSGVRLIPKYRRNMRGNSQEDARLIRQHRSMIETVNSQLEKMGLQRLHARTNAGVALKVLASLIALALTNAN